VQGSRSAPCHHRRTPSPIHLPARVLPSLHVPASSLSSARRPSASKPRASFVTCGELEVDAAGVNFARTGSKKRCARARMLRTPLARARQDELEGVPRRRRDEGLVVCERPLHNIELVTTRASLLDSCGGQNSAEETGELPPPSRFTRLFRSSL
jgi:hypothetical protein